MRLCCCCLTLGIIIALSIILTIALVSRIETDFIPPTS